MTLKDINLTEEQQKELKTKLDAWRLQERKKIEEELTEKYEQMEAQIKEEYENIVEEIKGNMKKVYTKRFSKALKEMYEVIKTEVMVENLSSPEAKALDEIKALIYPFINESTIKRHTDEFTKLAKMYEENISETELLKGANKKAQLLESLSPDVRKVVDKLIGEGTTEEIVEKFATIKKALKEQADNSNNTSDNEINETINSNTDDDMDFEDDSDEVTIERDVDEDEETIDEEIDHDFEKQLNEQLILAGVKKS